MLGVLTVIGSELPEAEISQVTDLIEKQDLSIVSSRRMTLQPTSLGHEAIEFEIDGPRDRRKGSHWRCLAGESNLDIVFQPNVQQLGRIKLAVFDMDSTLLDCEVIDELAKLAGVGEEVAKITESAMRGEIDYAESFRNRLSLLEGLSQGQVQAFADRLPIASGARALVATVRNAGCHTAICSGGFSVYARRLQEELGIDSIYANELEIVDGRVTGRVVGEIVDGERKAARLRSLAAQLGAPLAETMAVGDGANDIPMILAAGLGVAFHAKPKVRDQAPTSIDHSDLDAILHLIGVHEKDFVN